MVEQKFINENNVTKLKTIIQITKISELIFMPSAAIFYLFFTEFIFSDLVSDIFWWIVIVYTFYHIAINVVLFFLAFRERKKYMNSQIMLSVLMNFIYYCLMIPLRIAISNMLADIAKTEPGYIWMVIFTVGIAILLVWAILSLALTGLRISALVFLFKSLKTQPTSSKSVDKKIEVKMKHPLLNEELQIIGNMFKSGLISLAEYESKRKILIDKYSNK